MADIAAVVVDTGLYVDIDAVTDAWAAVGFVVMTLGDAYPP